MTLLVVSGTGTDVGKTVTVAAIASCKLATGASVAVLKPAQTGVDDEHQGDIADVKRLAGDVAGHELVRFPDPLAPNTAARRAGAEAVRFDGIVEMARRLEAVHDIVLIEGSGGLLVRLDDHGNTIAEVAKALQAPVVVVVNAGLGTLNATELTIEAMERRGIECMGLVIGRWPATPDLASRTNIAGLRDVSGSALLGALPDGIARERPGRFRDLALCYLAPELGGCFDAGKFAGLEGPASE